MIRGRGLQRVVRCAIAGALVASACTGGGSQPGGGDGTSATDSPGEFAVDEAIHIETLANRLRVYVRENRTPGRNAEMRLVVDAGSVNETPEQNGVAHFLEHMLFNGTEKFPGNELVATLRDFGMDFGADVNAYTSYDETVYQLSVPLTDSGNLDTGLDILAEWLSAATLDPQEVAAESGVVLDEWRQSEQSYGGRISDRLEVEYLAGSAYEGHDPIGDQPAIESMTAELLRDFYDKWYRPDNAAVIVVGDFDAENVLDDIRDRFGALAPRGPAPSDPVRRPDTSLPSYAEPSAVVFADPDTSVVEVELTLPTVWEGLDTEDDLRSNLLTNLSFELIVTRFADDLARGDGEFTDAYRSNNSMVTPLDAPSVVLTADPADLDAVLDALLVEFERAHRDGFDPTEVDRALDSFRAAAEDAYTGSESTGDTEYADQYVAHFLTGGPLADARAQRDMALGLYDSITPDDVHTAFSARYAAAGPHLLVLLPDTLAETVVEAIASEEGLLARMEAMAGVAIEPRQPSIAPDDEADDDAGDGLMAAPEPVEEVDTSDLTSDFSSFLEPVQLTFANGARVVLNPAEIITDQVSMSAVSPGGLSLVADGDVPEALIAAEVMSASGIGELDPVQLDSRLSATSVQFQAYLDPTEEGFYATSTTSDVETVLQLFNLTFTDPRFDQPALDSVIDSWQPYVDDPSADPDLAYYAAYAELRYGDEPRYRVIPTVDDLAALDLVTLERVWRQRFSNVGDWVISLSGDFDVDEVTELARRYVGSLAGGGAVETFVDLEPDPPAKRVQREVRAGSGDKGTLTLVFDVAVDTSADDRESVLAHLLTTVLTNRLTDHVREELGASYSPYGEVTVYTAPNPLVETVVQITGDPDQLDVLAAVVQEDLAALRDAGPTDAEFDDALAAAEQEYDLFDNDTIADLLARTPAHPQVLEAFIERRSVLADVEPSALRGFIALVLPANRYFDLRLLPA